MVAAVCPLRDLCLCIVVDVDIDVLREMLEVCAINFLLFVFLFQEAARSE